MIDLIGRLRDIQQRANHILDLVGATLRLTETGGTLTTDGTEQNIYRVETPLGIFEPRKLLIDFTNQTDPETVVIRTYYRIKNGGNLIQKDEVTYAGVQDPALINIELEPNRFGIQVTIEKTAGTNRAYDWCVFMRV